MPKAHRTRRVIHHLTNTPEHAVWSAMKRRCSNPRAYAYARYGGRGITVCERWQRSFLAFLADLGRRPTPKHTLERINNNGNYEPDNCRWATRKEQCRNQSSNRIITFRGESMCMAAWAERAGLTVKTLHWRLKHWPLERAMTAPLSW